jgi:hypothetical protein
VAVNNMIITYCQEPGKVAEAARHGFWSSEELYDLEMLIDRLPVAAARWAWQCGDAAAAQHVCRLEHPLGVGRMHLALRSGSSKKVPAAELEVLAADGVLPASAQPLEELAQWVAEEAAQQKPGTGLQLVQQAYKAEVTLGPAAASAMLTSTGDPEEQRLYELFPHFLNHLVSQVRGREASLVIGPKAAHSLGDAGEAVSSLHLKAAATGQVHVFGWREPGDVEDSHIYEVLKMDAWGRGCRDPDLLQNFAAVEPLGWNMPRGRSSTSSTTTSSSSSGSRASAGLASGFLAEEEESEFMPSFSMADIEAAIADAQASIAAAGSDASGAARTSSPRRKHCEECGEQSPKLKLCTQCRIVCYCSKKCQVAHWRAGHKQECNFLARLTASYRNL